VDQSLNVSANQIGRKFSMAGNGRGLQPVADMQAFQPPAGIPQANIGMPQQMPNPAPQDKRYQFNPDTGRIEYN
jgi:hypothetical protein